MEDIAITGLGVISSLGHNADDRGLQNGIATYLPDDLRAVSFLYQSVREVTSSR